MSTKELKSPIAYQNIQPTEVGQDNFYGQNIDREPSEINRKRVTHRNVNMVNYGEVSEGRPGSRWWGTMPTVSGSFSPHFVDHQSKQQKFFIASNGAFSVEDDNSPGTYDNVFYMGDMTTWPVITQMSEYEDRAYVIGSNRLFRAVFADAGTDFENYIYQINVDRPTEVLPDVPEEEGVKEYGYRYIYSGLFMEGLNEVQVYIQTFVANAANDQITIADSTVFPTGTRVQVTTDNTIPPGLAEETDYYSIVVDGTHIRLAESYDHSQAGDYIDITGAGVGTHRVVTLLRQNRISDGIRIGMETGTCKNPDAEKDYGEIFCTDAIVDNASYWNTITDEYLAVPFKENGNRWRQYTHFGIYRTKNIGKNSGGISPTTGKGNDPEFYCWVEDVPCCKAFNITIAGNIATVTAGQVRPSDVGSTLRDSAGNEGVIDTYQNRTQFTLVGGHALGAGATTVALGSTRVMTASQAGTVITRTAGDTFTNADIGKPYFWADGGISIIRGYINGNIVATVNSTTHASQAATLDPMRRGFTDILPDDGNSYGEVGLHERMQSGLDIYIPPRFWEPIPAGDRVFVDSGFMFVFNASSSTVYYCEIAAKEYWAGQYRADHQFFILPAECVGARLFPGIINFFCKRKTLNLALNVAIDVGRNTVGESIQKLNNPSVVDDDVGVASVEHMRALVPIRQGLLIGVTDEPAVRYYDGTGWSDRNLAMGTDGRGAIQFYINRMVGTGIFGAYTEQGGYILWLDYYARNGHAVECTLLALRYAVETAQGEGWSEYRGDDWLWPIRLSSDGERMTGQIQNYIDRDGNKRNIIGVLYEDGGTYVHWYEHSTWQRSTAYGPAYVEKADTPPAYGVAETEIETESWFGEEIVGELDEHSKFEDMVSHYGTRPQDYHNRGITGYDDNGYRDDQEFSQEVYADGALAAPQAVVSDIPENGDVVFPGTHVEARRLLYVFKSDTSEFKLTRRQHFLLPKYEQGSRTERVMGETTNGRNIVDNLVYRLSRHRLPLYEYIRAAQIAGNCNMIDGPDDRQLSAFELTANLNLLNPAVAGAYTVIFWMQAGVTVPALPALTQYGAAYESWTMQYVQNNNCPANLVVTVGRVYDIIICSGDQTAALAALYRDVINNKARAFGVFF